jgi:Ca2+-transporting ATPase
MGDATQKLDATSADATHDDRDDDAGPAWHTLDPEEVARICESSPHGLDDDEATRRHSTDGPNEIEGEPPTPVWRTIAHQFTDPLVVVLIVAAVVTLLKRDYTDTIVIAAVVILNSTIGFTQERRAERSVRSLASLVSPSARVLRGGHEREIPSAEVVVGDVVLLESGARVPADIRLARATALAIDESLLTGESVPVEKKTTDVELNTPLAERHNMAWAGSVVTTGRGRGHVVAIATDTELGAVADSLRTGVSPATPLQDRMKRLALLIGVTVGVSAVAAFVLGIAVGESPGDMFSFSVALAVMAIPEGLPVVVTITLALGVSRMTKRNALIRQLPAVETLGSTTVIGTDKTGTLTENRMTVEVLWDGTRSWEPDADDTAEAAADRHSVVHRLLAAGVLANEAEAYLVDGRLHTEGDPTEAALLVAADAAGSEPEQLRDDNPVTAEIPFESERGWSAAVAQVDGSSVLYLKGAPERVVAMCGSMASHGVRHHDDHDDDTATPFDRDAVLEQAGELAARGLRVLAFAERSLGPDHDPESAPDEPKGLAFLGFSAMLDPPRHGVADAIAACRRAGIRTVMVTGDHAITALAIARRLGITDDDTEHNNDDHDDHDDNDDDSSGDTNNSDTNHAGNGESSGTNSDDGLSLVLTGNDIDTLDDEQLLDACRTIAVIARAAPDHKLRVVKAMQANGDVVAMTGDGVNDAPALKAADIGVAMGRDGTDVARDAADMVLADDNYVTLASAVEEGRAAFDNVRKVTFFLLSTGVAGIVALLGGLVLGWPLLMVPAQILWLNLVTKGLQDVALAFEPPEPGLLDRPPRRRNEGVMWRLLWERTVLVAVVMAAGTLIQFNWVYETTGSLTAARTAALTTMVVFQAYFLVTVRSESRSALATPPMTNPFLFLAAIGGLLVNVVAMYLPPTQVVLQIEPLSGEVWIRTALIATSILVAVEGHKLVRNRWGYRNSTGS